MPVWSYRYRDDRHGIDAALLSGMEHALQELARGEPDVFLSIVQNLAEAGTETANFLVVRGFLGWQPTCSPTRPRTICSAMSDACEPATWTTYHWAARELIAAILPHLAVERRERLEAVLLDYATPWETSPTAFAIAVTRNSSFSVGRIPPIFPIALDNELPSCGGSSRANSLLRREASWVGSCNRPYPPRRRRG